MGGLGLEEKAVGSLLCRSGLWNIAPQSQPRGILADFQVYFTWILPKLTAMPVGCNEV